MTWTMIPFLSTVCQGKQTNCFESTFRSCVRHHFSHQNAARTQPAKECPGQGSPCDAFWAPKSGSRGPRPFTHDTYLYTCLSIHLHTYMVPRKQTTNTISTMKMHRHTYTHRYKHAVTPLTFTPSQASQGLVGLGFPCLAFQGECSSCSGRLGPAWQNIPLVQLENIIKLSTFSSIHFLRQPGMRKVLHIFRFDHPNAGYFPILLWPVQFWLNIKT